MKKMIVIVIISVFVSCIAGMLIGMGCVSLKSNFEEKAEQLVEELAEHDNDGNGHISIIEEHGFLGYKVTFYSSWKDEEPDVYVFDIF